MHIAIANDAARYTELATAMPACLHLPCEYAALYSFLARRALVCVLLLRRTRGMGLRRPVRALRWTWRMLCPWRRACCRLCSSCCDIILSFHNYFVDFFSNFLRDGFLPRLRLCFLRLLAVGFC